MRKMPEILAIIGGGKGRGKGPDMEDDEEPAPSSKDYADEKLGLVDELLSAMDKKDKQGIADALEAFVMTCQE